MENRAHAIIAICFLLVFGVGAFLVFHWLTSAPGEPLTYRIVTSQSVNGLARQSKVLFKGLEVGHVDDIRFDPSDRSRVIVDFKVREKTYITHATYAELAMQGLTGGEALELKLGTGSPAPLRTSARSPAHIPLHQGLLAKLESSAQSDLKDVHEILDSARKVLGGQNREHIEASLRQIDTITARLAAIEGQLTPVAKELPALVQSVQDTVRRIHDVAENADRLAREARGPVKKAGRVEDSVSALGLKLNQQTVPDIDTLSRNLLRTSRQLDQVLRELKAKPQSLIFGPPQLPPGPGEPGFDKRDKGDSRHE